MVTRTAKDGVLFLVVNAACKDADFAHIERHLPAGVTLERLDGRALIALQGPGAAEVFARFAPDAAAQTFMTGMEMNVAGIPCMVSRSGYTGEDGYEISVPAAEAVELTRKVPRASASACSRRERRPPARGPKSRMRPVASSVQ